MVASQTPGCQQALANLHLPQLDRLLARLTPAAPDSGDASSPEPPHERALAAALGLPTQATPWAAWHQRETAQACAWITPCQWQVGADRIVMADPAQLQLDEAASRALLEIVGGWLAQDGIALHYEAPTRWRAQGALFEGLACASLDRVIGRDVRAWMPQGAQARLAQRLHSEVQMLLYTHAFSAARAAQGLPAINAFWVHGAGRLATMAPTPVALPEIPRTLIDAALREDWGAWAQAWQALDRGIIAECAAQQAEGVRLRLTLCGERAALCFDSAGRGWRHKISGLFRLLRFTDLRDQL